MEDQRFSIVPEWVIDADLPDSSFRLYCLLLRYGNGTGHRMPSRATLARRLRRSVDAIDRALKALSEAGVVRVEHRRAGAQPLPNRYHVRTSDPAVPHICAHPCRRNAARGSRTRAANLRRRPRRSRRTAATPRCRLGDREILTQRSTPPPALPARPPLGEAELLTACGIDDLDGLSTRLVAIRRGLGTSTTRWSGPCLLAAIQLAVTLRGWPVARIVDALLVLAADDQSRSPARLAEAGPWWDEAPADELDPDTLAALEWRLAETGGVRPLVQRLARQELTAEGLPRTRSTVAQRACQILDRRAAEKAATTTTANETTSDPTTFVEPVRHDATTPSQGDRS